MTDQPRMTIVRKPDLKVLGKVNECGTDCAGICRFYGQCSAENVWGTLNSLPELVSGTRGYYFGKLDGPTHCAQHMVGIEVPAAFDRALPGMALLDVPGALYAVFVNPNGNGAPWGEAEQWVKETTVWSVRGDLPWAEDDGPAGCSLLFVPVASVQGMVPEGVGIHDYPMPNEAIATVASGCR
ncbi:MAG: GyrI-like domain-containing protein [Victivallales bacterium]|nr:GyrI-like domain-containing protein [Victivallales bacterium]